MMRWCHECQTATAQTLHSGGKHHTCSTCYNFEPIDFPEDVMWVKVERPGYFGRRRDKKIAELNLLYGPEKWKLMWVIGEKALEFVGACQEWYEESYFRWLKTRPADLKYICSFGEVIDNAPTNIASGLDYSKQESYSTHIQDIAIRNVLKRLDRKFLGEPGQLLTIRGKDTNGFRFMPGKVPFLKPGSIDQPSKSPEWSDKGSVEDFWQSNKWLMIKKPE